MRKLWSWGRVLAASVLVCSCMSQSSRPANYAGDRGPRFKSLIYYTENAEEAHVQFSMQAIDFYRKLTVGNGFEVDVTQSLEGYTPDSLGAYSVIIMANALPGSQEERKLFEQYMENGGGWVGFHAAGYNDRNTNWPWFNEFLGCGTFLCNNWPPQSALVEVNVRRHDVTKNLPKEFVIPASEYYQFNWPGEIGGGKDIEVLISLSQKNYPIGLKDIVYCDEWPLVWTNKDYRMIYLNMGHGDDEFTDATQNLLFVNALRWIVASDRSGNTFDR